MTKTRLNAFEKYYPDESNKLVIIDEPVYKNIKDIFSGCIREWE